MARLSDWNLKKVQLRMNAGNERPERPRIQEQLGLEKSLIGLREQSSAENRKIQNEMFDELSQKWKGKHGGSAGDALISGLKAGIKEGSFMEDKERYKNLISSTEKLKNMVEHQNEELFRQENLFNARKSATPRIMAYLESYKGMSPNDRKIYLQNAMDEYNQSAGTDYRVVDFNGSEPWKITVSDGEEIVKIDLMDFIKTPEEKKLEYYLNSNEVKSHENELRNEDRLNREILENNARYSKAREDEKSPINITEKKKQLIESGEIPEGAILFDELKGPEFKQRLEDLKIQREQGIAAERGIEALDAMKKIFKDHPNISTSLARWALSKNPGPWSTVLRLASNEDDIDALLELEKHASVLNIGTLAEFKGQRPTDILKKLIISMNPGSNFTYKAFLPIEKHYKSKFEKIKSKSKEADEGFNKRYFPPYSSTQNNNEIQPDNSVMQDLENRLKSIPGLTREEMEEALRRFKNGQ